MSIIIAALIWAMGVFSLAWHNEQLLTAAVLFGFPAVFFIGTYIGVSSVNGSK